MELSGLVFLSLLLFLAFAQSYSLNTTIASQCHEKERLALLKFKTTFYNESSCSYYPLSDSDVFPRIPGQVKSFFGQLMSFLSRFKFNSYVLRLFLGDYKTDLKTWTAKEKNRECCNWDGVVCDERNGHVIGLLLSGTCLSGSIDSSSSIFELVHLQFLDLSYNDFHYSRVPSAISNLSSLTTLRLEYSKFSGQIPSEILLLTNLSSLQLSMNQLTLTSPSLRELVQTLVKLEYLGLDGVNISSLELDSMSRQSSLRSLTLSRCGLQGHIPPSIANLVSLEMLQLRENNLVGEIPSSFWNLTQLNYLDLSSNELTGEIFPQLLTFTNLISVDLSYNIFGGQIPTTISHLKNLSTLSVQSNNFSGKIYLDDFFKLENLASLALSFNNFSLVAEPTIKPHQKLVILFLASCNLTSFPKFLKDQDNLSGLDLSYNNIFGEVPEWFFGFNTKPLYLLDLSHNYLTGSLPALLTNTSIRYYLVSNNEFYGELPTRMCTLITLKVLDLANNNLSGEIPPCITDLVSAGNLSLLSLRSNNFNGQIPELGKNKCNLVMIDLSSNQLEGSVPRDIENCINLQFVNLGNNRISDVFPSWLGKLPALCILILRSNRFHGIIDKHDISYKFPKLRIIDLSNNNLTSHLVTLHFEGWSEMKVDADKIGRTLSYASYGDGSYYYTLKMTNKHIILEYTKIPDSLIAISLSYNNFTGEIPQSIGTLKGVRLLNLSNNMLTGSIPFDLNGLSNLESLDLSHNKLSGKIPQQLTDLTSLSSFDVSFNQLIGPIPSSKQFGTFNESSYQGNPGLCGPPLSRKCANLVDASPPPFLENDHASRILIDWKIVSMGYASGFVIGVTIGMKCTRGCKRVKKVRHIKFILD